MAKQTGKRRRISEEQELENAYQSVSGGAHKPGKYAKTHRKSGIVIICIALVAVVVSIAAGYIYFSDADMDKVIQHNVSVAGVNVMGMTQGQAVEAVTAATSGTLGKKEMEVTVLDSKIQIPGSCIRSFDVKGAVKAAYKYDPKNQTSSLSPWPIDLAPYLEMDTQKIKDALEALGSNYNTALKQTKCEVTGTAPKQTLVIQKGTPEYGLDLQALYEQVLAAYSGNVFSVEGSCGIIEPEDVDLEAVLSKHYIAPVNATLDPKTHEIVPGVDGYGFDIAAAKKKLDEAAYGARIEIPFTAIPPEVTSDNLTQMLYRDQLATFTATAESDPDRDTNLRLACEAINGMILNPGEIFSYNEALGERTAKKGYKPGPMYVGDKTVLGTGGGICQVSSALYYCAMVSDLEILVRKNHGFAPSYVPLGMDATITWGSLDLRFKNTSGYPIRIEASAEGGSTTITLVGTDAKDYYVKMEYEVLNTYDYELTYQTMAENNPDGYKNGDYIEEPFTGYDIKTYRCKYDKLTDELISKDLEATSNYRKRDGVVCKIG